jgi:hypothetical protein
LEKVKKKKEELLPFLLVCIFYVVLSFSFYLPLFCAPLFLSNQLKKVKNKRSSLSIAVLHYS